MTPQQRYLPFGQIRTDVASPNSQSLITDLGYTGQRNLDDDIGLMDYRARFYSPVLNRFIQPDMIVPGMYNPQMMNRFSYVGNNPINFNDPTGHCGVTITSISNGTYSGPCPIQIGDSGNSGGSLNGLVINSGGSVTISSISDDYDIIIDMLEGAPSNQEVCEFFLSGADLLCNPETWDFSGFDSWPEPNPYELTENDLVYPWEINRLSAIGLRVDLGGFILIPIAGGGGYVDFIFNFYSEEFSVMPSGYGMGGIVAGGSLSPSLVLVYDAPNNDALTGTSGGGTASFTPLIGIQASYSSSGTPGYTGLYAQTYTIGPSFGAEFSIAGTLGKTPWNLVP